MSLRDIAKQVIQLMPELPREAGSLIDSIQAPGALADLVAANLDAPVEEKAQLLETVDVKERIRKVLRLLTRQLEILKMRERINSQIKEEMGKNQREYVLRQQLKAIKEELGEDDGDQGDLDGLEERIAKANLPTEAEKVAKKQLKRLRNMQVGSAEYTVVRTYLDWILDLPWHVQTPDNLDIAAVRKVLDEDHYGLEKVKKRILEYLAVRKLKKDKKGPILCLIGPPGVGKTSLGRSIARALGRKFAPHLARRRARRGGHPRPPPHVRRRAARPDHPGHEEGGHDQPGLHDGRGRQDRSRLPRRSRGGAARGARPRAEQHVRGSLPRDPVRPLERHVRRDGERRRSRSPPPLRDRMEILEIPGYTRREKLAIARQHLIPKQLEEHGITTEQLDITDTAVEIIIDHYTREAGVRTLERQIASVIRGVAVKIAEGDLTPRKIDNEDQLREFLGAAAVHERGRRAHRGAGRRHGPGLDAASAARSSSSRRRACTARASCSSPASSATS